MAQDNRIYYGPKNVCFIDSDVGAGCTVGAGSVPAAVADYVSADEFGDGKQHTTVLTVTALPISTVDNGTAGHGGGTKVYDFPKGYIHVLGGATKWTLITADGTGLTNAAELDIAIGSTVANSTMASLSGTALDIVTKDDITLSTSVSATNQTQGDAGQGGIDGTSTAVDAYINVACSAATADANGTLTLTGKIVIDWRNYGYAGE